MSRKPSPRRPEAPLGRPDTHGRTSTPTTADPEHTVVSPIRAPRGAAFASGGERPAPPGRRSGPVKLTAARAGRRRWGWEAAVTKSGRVGTARRLGSGERDGEVYVRNQRLKPLSDTASSNLVDVGRYAAHARFAGRLPGRFVSAGGEATGKACGVPVARPQGAGLGTDPVDRRAVNVGTRPGLPFAPASRAGGGRARPSMSAVGGGAVVVVRDRESRPHGEGRQLVRSGSAGMPGGHR